MPSLASILSPIEVSLDDVLLDPNNPRFSDLGEDFSPIQEIRFADPRVQSYTFDRMKADSFDVAELRDTIKTLGFLPMDKIVLRKWRGGDPSNQKYVVVEGNRRVTALKWLMILHETGKESFDVEQINNFTRLNCLIIDDEHADASTYLILPGLRHVSGIKEWGPYQKAKAVFALRRSGMSAQQAAQSLGLSTRAANSAYRCYLALESMKNDEEFGEFAQPKLYSYFEEIFKKPNLRTWLGWQDDREVFTEEVRLNEFYSWIVPVDGEGTEKISNAIGVRDFAAIVEDESALSVLRATGGTLSRALARFESDHPTAWLPKIEAAASALSSLTPSMLRALSTEQIVALNGLRQAIETALADRELLQRG